MASLLSVVFICVCFFNRLFFSNTPTWWRYTIQAPISGNLAYSVPKRLPFAFDTSKIYVNDYNGNIYAVNLHSGTTEWTFSTNNYSPYPVTTDTDNNLAVADFDSNIYMIDSATGAERWRFTIPDRFLPDTPAYMTSALVFVGARNGVLYAIDKHSGSIRWSYSSNTPPVTSFVLGESIIHFGMIKTTENRVYIISPQRKFFILNTLTGDIIRTIPLTTYTQREPITQGNEVGVYDEPDTILWFDSQTGNMLRRTLASTVKPQENSLIQAAQSVGNIDINPITATIVHNTLYFASKNLLHIYAIPLTNVDKKGITAILSSCCAMPKIAKPIIPISRWTQSPQLLSESLWKSIHRLIALYAHSKISSRSAILHPSNPLIYEITFTHDDTAYRNPWTDVRITTVFTHESGKTYSVQGFYYDHNIWKVRFAPPFDGVWRWHADITNQLQTLQQEGSFTATYITPQLGYVRITQNIPPRFVYDSGKPFWGRGLEDVIRDYNYDGDPINQWADINTNPTESHRLSFTDMDTYFRTYNNNGNGFNLYRFGVDNYAFRLWRTIDEHNAIFSVSDGIWGDQLVQTLRNNRYAVWMTVFGFTPPIMRTNPDHTNKATRAYLDYISARYGAYVDIWELTNEASPSGAWISEAARYLQSVDPYGHPVTTSWERPDLHSMDIISAHWYDSSPRQTVDLATTNVIQQFTKWKKPIVISETGNKTASWFADSALYLRIKLWVSFFNNSTLIYWNQVRQYFENPTHANIYIGKNELQYMSSFGTFVSTVPVDVVPFTLITSNPNVRSYWMRSEHVMIGYLYHYSDNNMKESTTFTLRATRKGILTWYDPSSGLHVGQVDIKAGDNILTTPPFHEDLAITVQFQ